MTLLRGDLRSVLAELEPQSVHFAMTSPPFYAKRKYSGDTQTQVWGGEPGCGDHEWGRDVSVPESNLQWATDTEARKKRQGQTIGGGQYTFCVRCGAWRGALGHEPHPDLFVAHLVECFAAVWRVLRDDGVLVVEINDSYAGGKGRSGQGSPEYQATRQDVSLNRPHHQIGGPGLTRPTDLPLAGIPAQTRIGIPERFALAMAADGWRWRDSVIWRHTSAMPESVGGWSWQRCRVKVGKGRPTDTGTWAKGAKGAEEGMIEGGGTVPQWADCPGCPKCEPSGGYVLRWGQWRTTVAHSYVYVFSKTNRYYGDGEAVRQPPSREWWLETFPRNKKTNDRNDQERLVWGSYPSGSNLRSVLDIGPEPFTLELCGACGKVYDRRHYDRLKRVDGKRVCGCGSADFVSHYATFPTKLPELFIRAFTSEAGCCPKCAAPWARVIDRPQPPRDVFTQTEKPQDGFHSGSNKDGEWVGIGQKLTKWREDNPAKTLGWRPTCRHEAPAVPCVVLDPFVGTGSTLVAAKRNGRFGIGVDVAQDYLDMAAARLAETPAALL